MPRIVVKNFIKENDGTSDVQISFLKDMEIIFKGKVQFEYLNAKENETLVMKYKIKELPTIIIECDNKEKERFAGLTQQRFLKKAIERINKEVDIKVDCSLGSLEIGMVKDLKALGVNRYNHNLETSETYYKNICTTHPYKNRLSMVGMLKDVGLNPKGSII